MSSGDTLVELATDGMLVEVQNHLKANLDDINYKDSVSIWYLFTINNNIITICVVGGIQIGWTALHIASRNGHIDIVKYLIKTGADINTKNNVCTSTIFSN